MFRESLISLAIGSLGNKYARMMPRFDRQSTAQMLFLNLFRYICGHADWDRAQNTGNKYIASVYSVPLQAVVPVLCFGRRTHELVAMVSFTSLKEKVKILF